MGIKKKRYPVPDSSPPTEDSPEDFYPCWGCDRKFYYMSFMADDDGLCHGCARKIRKPGARDVID